METKLSSTRVKKALAICVIALVGLTTGAVFANYLGNGRFPTRNLDWRFFGTTSANGSYTSPVAAGMSHISSQTDVNFSQISNNNWDIAQYVANWGASGWLGYAYICNTSGVCDNPTAWNGPTTWYCIARENRYYLDSRGYNGRRAVSTHEAGHCLSLAHTNSTNDVMYTYIASTEKTTLSSVDRSDINARY